MVQLRHRYVVVQTRCEARYGGTLLSRKKDVVVLRDARRLWNWSSPSALEPRVKVCGVTKMTVCTRQEAEVWRCEPGDCALAWLVPPDEPARRRKEHGHDIR
jgi:hypothetical protein